MILMIFVAIFIGLLTKWFLHINRFEKYLKKFKGPRPLPIIGNVLEFGTSTELLPTLLHFSKKYDGVCKIYLGFSTVNLFISDAKFVEYILSSPKLIEKSSDYIFLQNWLGTGLLTSGGAKWKRHRKIITPAFHFQILEQFIEIFDLYSNTLIERLSQEVGKKSFDVYPYVTLCSLDIICATSMGTKINAQSNSESKYVQSVKEMSRIFMERTFSAIKMVDCFYKLSKDYRKEMDAVKVLHEYTYSVIDSRKKELASCDDNNLEVDDIGRKKRRALLDLLLQYKKDGQTITDEEIREEVDTIMFEGHDTTSSAISFTIYQLAKHPDVQKKALQEQKNILGDDQGKSVTYKELQEMKYLEAVIKETLRLYPSVPMYARNLQDDVEYDDVVLPKGTSLVIFAYGLHRNPEIFSNPDFFNPERFMNEKHLSRSAYAYVPFSAGSRNCIGQKFAMLEMKTVMSKVLRNYELLEAPGHELILAAETILKSASGICIQLNKRQ